MIVSQLKVSADTGEWVTKASTPTEGGFGETIVGIGNSIYAVRAYSVGNCYFWKYDPTSDSWTTLFDWTPDNPIPRPKSGTAFTWDHGDNIYALLGGAYNDTDRRYFYRYTISTDSWSRLADTPHTQGAGDAITWSTYDGRIYALLGSNGHGSAFACYNSNQNIWETLNLNNWITDDGASLVSTGGEYLYAFRGEWEETVPHNDFVRYHIPSGNWETLTPMPVPTNEGVGDGASLLWIGNWMSSYSDYIYALEGGSVLENPRNGFYSYSISANNWIALTSVSYPVGNYTGNRLGFANNHIYYWQGTPSNSFGNGVTFQMFNMPTVSTTTTIVQTTTTTSLTSTTHVTTSTMTTTTYQSTTNTINPPSSQASYGVVFLILIVPLILVPAAGAAVVLQRRRT